MDVGLRQLCQWAMAAAPGHPALQRVVDIVTKNALGGAVLSSSPDFNVILRTGPAPWTDAVLPEAAAGLCSSHAPSGVCRATTSKRGRLHSSLQRNLADLDVILLNAQKLMQPALSNGKEVASGYRPLSALRRRVFSVGDMVRMASVSLLLGHHRAASSNSCPGCRRLNRSLALMVILANRGTDCCGECCFLAARRCAAYAGGS